MKPPTQNEGPRRPRDSRSALVVLAALALQGLLVYVIVAIAFPGWRPHFLDPTSDPPPPLSRTALPSAPALDDGLAAKPVTPTDAAHSRMLFGGSGSALLGDRLPEAPRPHPSGGDPAAHGEANPALPPDAPSPTANLAFQRYVEWLRGVELERQRLRNWAEQQLPEVLASAPGSPERKQGLAQAQSEVKGFRYRMVQTKPVVPADCRVVDQYYAGAITQEGVSAAALLEALAGNDPDLARRLQRSGTGRVDRDLTVANAKLEQSFRKRGEPLTLRLAMGQDASVLGAMAELHVQPSPNPDTPTLGAPTTSSDPAIRPEEH